jgi:hypothetical protein
VRDNFSQRTIQAARNNPSPSHLIIHLRFIKADLERRNLLFKTKNIETNHQQVVAMTGEEMNSIT